jgi:hypothetical protein
LGERDLAVDVIMYVCGVRVTVQSREREITVDNTYHPCVVDLSVDLLGRWCPVRRFCAMMVPVGVVALPACL